MIIYLQFKDNKTPPHPKKVKKPFKPWTLNAVSCKCSKSVKILESFCIYNKIEKLTKCTIVGVRLVSVGKRYKYRIGEVREEFVVLDSLTLQADSLPSELPGKPPDWN